MARPTSPFSTTTARETAPRESPGPGTSRHGLSSAASRAGDSYALHRSLSRGTLAPALQHAHQPHRAETSTALDSSSVNTPEAHVGSAARDQQPSRLRGSAESTGGGSTIVDFSLF